ncbi:hypothetical protein I4U23_016251 [Adineta vaga]|nr:hypothetical protein I4U23_016251 [Adineta vaga]
MKQRSEVINHVQKFINEYIQAPNFISAFDDAIFTVQWPYSSTRIKILGSPLPSKSGGNQIVLTSRLIGYQLYPLLGLSIVHSALSLINHMETKEFIRTWIYRVESVLQDILRNEGLEVDKEKLQISSRKRYDNIETILNNCSDLFMSNPILLSLICTTFFQSSNEFLPKTRVEIYNRAIQSTISCWTNEQSNISQDILFYFFIDLACYLHLQSPSGLIDAFDIKHLCYLSLQKQGLSNNHRVLNNYVDKLLLLLNSNIGIVVERSLLVYSFLHLSFQEYFVAQSLLRKSSIHEIVQCIFIIIFNSRFRESIHLALNWINEKWSNDDYDQFYFLLISSQTDYAIPYGTLLFFDACKMIQRLPSDTIIILALNNLLDHPSHIIPCAYLSSNLFKLNELLIVKWMNLCFQDDKRFFKYCKCLLTTFGDKSDVFNFIPLPSIVCQQLNLFHNMNTSTQFIIDQTLRKRGRTKLDQISHILLKQTTIHPLIISVLICLCNGICFEEYDNELKINFSKNEFYRQSRILPIILTYLQNDEESSISKIEKLIKDFENILEKSSPKDTSLDVVDTFIALICLKNLSNLSIYQKYHHYLALPIALERFKWSWFYLRKSYNNLSYNTKAFESYFTREINAFLDQFVNEPDNQRSAFLFLCTMTWNKLSINSLSYESNINDHSVKWIDLNNMSENSYSSDEIEENICFLFTFIPEFLQELYYRIFILSTKKSKSFPLIILLSECLIYFENNQQDKWNFYLGLSTIELLFKKNFLDNYISVLFLEKRTINYSNNYYQKEFNKTRNNHLSNDWQILVDIERQRILQANNFRNSDEQDQRFFAASISLARLLQVKYRSQNKYSTEDFIITTSECNEINIILMQISNLFLRILAQIMIIHMNKPSIYNDIQKHHIQLEIINQIIFLSPNLSLLELTLIYVRCYEIEQILPIPFQQLTMIIGEKLTKNIQHDEHIIVFNVLRYLLYNNDLSYYLSKFVQQNKWHYGLQTI